MKRVFGPITAKGKSHALKDTQSFSKVLAQMDANFIEPRRLRNVSDSPLCRYYFGALAAVWPLLCFCE